MAVMAIAIHEYVRMFGDFKVLWMEQISAHAQGIAIHQLGYIVCWPPGFSKMAQTFAYGWRVCVE
jgi:hypothetical protein